jgi:hypothetical protein
MRNKSIGKTESKVVEERCNNEEEARSRADKQTHSNERSSERGLEEI